MNLWKHVSSLLIAGGAVALPATIPAGAQEISGPLGDYEMAYPFPMPDGKSIVFQGTFDGREQLYKMQLEDGAITRILIRDGDQSNPAVSPDGQRIAFISNETGNNDVYIMSLADGQVRSLAPHPGKDGHPKWSSDGEWIVFNRTFDPADVGGGYDAAILMVRPDGSDLKTISDTENIETFPSFSPDAKKVVFVEWFPGDDPDGPKNGDLVIVDVDSGERQRLTDTPAFDGYPHWGPSGEWVYYSSVVESEEGQREFVVFRISPQSGATQQLTPTDGVTEVRAMPMPGENSIVFNKRSPAGQTLLHRIEIK